MSNAQLSPSESYVPSVLATATSSNDRVETYEILHAIRWSHPPRYNPRFTLLDSYAAAHSDRTAEAGTSSREAEILACEVPRLAALTYPDAALSDLIVAHDWIQWLFIFDDQCDDGQLGRDIERLRETSNRLRLILSAGDGDPLPSINTVTERLLYEVRLRLRDRTTLSLQQRFANHVKDYLTSYEWETSNRVTSQLPTAEAYLLGRQQTSAVHSCFDISAICADVDVDALELRIAELKQLQFLACEVVSLINDIVSANKEGAHGDLHNLVLIYMHRHQTSANEAARRVVEVTQDRIDQFENLAGIIAERHREHAAALDRYLSGLRMWMVGNCEWSHTSLRYREIANGEGRSEATPPPVFVTDEVWREHRGA
jgi:hypothetical protein